MILWIAGAVMRVSQQYRCSLTLMQNCVVAEVVFSEKRACLEETLERVWIVGEVDHRKVYWNKSQM